MKVKFFDDNDKEIEGLTKEKEKVMKSILISIKPQYVCKILNKEKILEIRTTCPMEWKKYLDGKTNIKPKPCKVYIYCTKAGDDYFCSKEVREFADKGFCGSVGAEFILNKITKHEKNYIDVEDRLCYNFLCEDVKNAGFVNSEMDDWEKLDAYINFDSFVNNYGNDKPLYAWHIDDLKIYDKPKNIDSFIVSKVALDCGYGNYNIYNKVLSRPPQSWCYVEVQNVRD